MQHVLSRSKGRKNFVLVGYSFGSLVTIELARILEEKGFNGRLVLIDGSPDLVKAIVDQQLSSQSDEELENSVLLGIMNIIAPMLSSQVKELSDFICIIKFYYFSSLIPTFSLSTNLETKNHGNRK